IEWCSSMMRTKNLIILKRSSKKPRVFILLCPLITELLHRICAMHGNCLRLAQLHSKTGVPAEFPKGLRVSEYPDFMDKADKRSYESQKILRKLYRSIQLKFCNLIHHKQTLVLEIIRGWL